MRPVRELLARNLGCNEIALYYDLHQRARATGQQTVRVSPVELSRDYRVVDSVLRSRLRNLERAGLLEWYRWSNRVWLADSVVMDESEPRRWGVFGEAT